MVAAYRLLSMAVEEGARGGVDGESIVSMKLRGSDEPCTLGP